MNIPFNVLKPLYETLQDEMNTAVQRVLASGWYILGPEVEAFEQAFADYQGLPYAVGVANGTDAIELALRAHGIGAGDEVITVAHTAFATINAVERAGAKPVMVDIDPLTYTMDPAAAEAAVTPRTRAIIPVHIYGQPADIDALQAICDRHNLLLLEDCAQAHGARYKGRLVGTFGAAASFSFYPTKNLGAFGDGGAVVTRDPQIAARLKSLRNYGQAAKYHHEESGQNSRLDELQAAILGVKLAHLDSHNATRRALASVYDRCLSSVTIPAISPHAQSVYHLYVVRHPQRDALMSCLKNKGVGTAIHYPIPNHLQAACAHLGYSVGSLPATEQAAKEIVSLPLYIGLSPSEVEEVSAVISHEAGLLA
jgi:dTDP-3-amino-3,4,6-trideoxy-alpha-D-glucose transaminase